MKCPLCGSQMILRKATKGTFKGKYFWGCSQYPSCKGIVNIDKKENEKLLFEERKEEIEKDIKKDIDKNKLNIQENHVSTRKFYAAPYSNEYETFFFQSLGISEDILNELLDNVRNYEKIKLLSKFRIDILSKRSIVEKNEKRIFSLALRLLSRGKVTLNSSFIEKTLDTFFTHSKIYDFQHMEVIDNYIKYDKVINNFDSQNELDFLNNRIENIFGSNWASHVITQVYLNSITSDNFDENNQVQRIDFLLSKEDKNLILELDGPEHKEHTDKDRIRDNSLEKNGYKVIRIKNDNMFDDNELNKINFSKSKLKENYDDDKFIIAMKVIHQIEIAISKGLEQGLLTLDDAFELSINTDAFSNNEKEKILKLALDDLKNIYENFAKIYNIKLHVNFNSNDKKKVIISIGNNVITDRKIIIRDIAIKDDIQCEINAFDQIDELNYSESAIEYFLEYIFRYKRFNDGQKEAIERIIKKKDSIVLLPTGGGKSLIYQLTSFIVPGQTVIICPITALMNDQVDNLQGIGIDNCLAIYTNYNQKSLKVLIEKIKENNYCLIYISPERLQTIYFRNTVNAMLLNNTVWTITIDEAHCISEWGHDFRTAYLNIGKNSREIFKKGTSIPVLLALTGTASTAVLRDVQRELNIWDYNGIIVPKTFDRTELKFDVYESSNNNKLQVLKEVLTKNLPEKFNMPEGKFSELRDENSYCGIVFCPNVNGNFGIDTVSSELKKILKNKIGIYSGTAPKGINNQIWERTKRDYANAFKHNKINLLIATKAFGMGIDKKNIRYTIHYGIPGSIESFYQESGRAGRDREKSECIILFSNDNSNINSKLLDARTSLQEIKNYIENGSFNNNDDVSRMLYFHINSFKGIEEELDNVKKVVKIILSNDEEIKKTHYYITVNEDEKRNDLEKAIQRLVILGVIENYSVDYASEEYDISLNDFNRDIIIDKYSSYVRGYNDGRVQAEREKLLKESSKKIDKFVLGAAKVLIEFIYDTIERGRRRGLNEIVMMSKRALLAKDKDKEIRESVVRYFQSSYSEEISKILESKELGLSEIIGIFDGQTDELGEKKKGVISSYEALEIQGQVIRFLESTPDHPGLLFMKALSECYIDNFDIDIVISELRTGISFAIERYSSSVDNMLDFIIFVLKKIYLRGEEGYFKTLNILLSEENKEKLLNKLIKHKDIDAKMLIIPMLMHINNKSKEILNKTMLIRSE